MGVFALCAAVPPAAPAIAIASLASSLVSPLYQAGKKEMKDKESMDQRLSAIEKLEEYDEKYEKRGRVNRQQSTVIGERKLTSFIFNLPHLLLHINSPYPKIQIKTPLDMERLVFIVRVMEVIWLHSTRSKSDQLIAYFER